MMPTDAQRVWARMVASASVGLASASMKQLIGRRRRCAWPPCCHRARQSRLPPCRRCRCDRSTTRTARSTNSGSRGPVGQQIALTSSESEIEAVVRCISTWTPAESRPPDLEPIEVAQRLLDAEHRGHGQRVRPTRPVGLVTGPGQGSGQLDLLPGRPEAITLDAPTRASFNWTTSAPLTASSAGTCVALVPPDRPRSASILLVDLGGTVASAIIGRRSPDSRPAWRPDRPHLAAP